MTRLIASTWMPRAAMSVATRTLTEPAVNAARFRSRAPWARSPCSSAAGTDAAVSWAASLRAACQGGQDADPVGGRDGEHVMDHRDRGAVRVDRVHGRVGQEAPDQDVHVV